MKKTILFVGALIVATSMSAQINVGVNFLLGFPSGEWADGVNTGFGGGVEGNYFVNEDISVGLEVGFNSFGTDVDGASFSITPISIKGEYYFLDDEFRPFVGFGFGYYLVSGKSPGFPPLIPEVNATMNGFGISPRIGGSYQVSDLIAIVLNINYNILFGQTFGGDLDGAGDVDDPTNFIGVGIGARFNIAD